MTDVVMALIPDYGLLIIFAVVSAACLAVPLPSSMLVLASGAFAAAGDMVLWQVMSVAFLAFVVGDQIAFGIAGRFGPKILRWMNASPRMQPVIARSETLLEEKGRVAVLLSHTILSPTCPYVSYLCGAGGMNWRAFSGVATIGAAIWAAVYVMLGFRFATQISQVADLLGQFFGLVIAAFVLIFGIKWLRHRWAAHLAAAQAVSD